jgi:integrase
MSLGNADVIGLAEARQRHQEARAALARGIDPLAERQAAVAASRARHEARSFAATAAAYIEAHKAGWRGETEDHWRTRLAKHVFPVFGMKPVADVTTDDVLKALSPLWSKKSSTAVMLRSRIELVLSYAKSRGWRDGPNPAMWRDHLAHLLPRPAKVHQTEHRAALDWREAPALLAALGPEPSMAARCLRFVILTACRSGEARGCRWSELDLEQRLWTIPAGRMKSGREHRGPLSPEALAVLAEAAAVRTGDLVFWGRSGGVMADKTLTELLQRLGHGDVSVHGMRSTFRDWAADTGKPGDLAEVALAHVVGNQVARAYQRSDLLDARRPLMDAWAAFLTAPPAKVIPLQPRIATSAA